MSKTIVLITGANQGCGYEVAKNMLLSSKDYHILIGSRDATRGNEAAASLRSLPGILGTVDAVAIDVTSDASIEAAAAHVEQHHGRLDTLVNNAGILPRDATRVERVRSVFATNVVGPVAVTEAFLPLMRKSAAPRLVMVSSSMGSTSQAADPDSNYYKQKATEYRASKAALNMLIVQYWKELQDEGFKVLGADPGAVATNFADAEAMRKRGGGTPEDGGRRIAVVAKGERDVDVGRVCGEYDGKYGVSPW